MKQNRALLVVILIVWLAGMLFPFASLQHCSAAYRTAFLAVFHAELSHILMHTVLYAVLACLLAALLRRPHWSFRQLFVRIMPLVAGVAVLQEIIQIACEREHPGPDELFDFCVDLAGGLLGLVLFAWLARRSCRSKNYELEE